MPDVTLVTVKAALDAATTSAGNRNYCGVAIQSPPRPYTVLTRVADVPRSNLGSSAVNPKHNIRIQIDGYAETYLELMTLQGQIRTAMAVAAFTNILLMEQDIYEPDVRLHRSVMDYSIWT